MGSYIPADTRETDAMLDAVGVASFDELYRQVPPEARIDHLDIAPGVSEIEALAHMEQLAERNTRFASVFRGAGAYRHYIPAIVRTVTAKEEFLTAYTPYQAEISQGVLQSIFEYQTQVCELTGMDVSNASVYDGATAAAEGLLMCLDRRRDAVVVSGTAHPQTIETIRTYCASRKVSCTVVAATADLSTDAAGIAAALDATVAAVYVQSPNYYGIIEDVGALAEAAHGAGAKLVQGFNPISLGLIRTPGEHGADIAVGEGQCLGLPLGFGGPYLGIMCADKGMVRKLPGRIVGETADADGRRAFVLTLQAREQHIRREKASSNICSNEALCAMAASAYLAALGDAGLARVAELSYAHAHYLADRLGEMGFALLSDKPFFNEFATSCPKDAAIIEEALAERGILSGLPLPEGMLWCATELNTKIEIDALIDALREV
ncbi:aminomethyl-transferring glycine dehydrogenase subunit GcvPA [Coriobacteriales bacterium OH1046]|nr:aminomethyl-transferring glycine dehydrogenase subunit GcvPA [Coriobacteriales bacterium OH1046]